MIAFLTACLPFNTGNYPEKTILPSPTATTEPAAIYTPTPLQIQETAVHEEGLEKNNPVWEAYTNANYIKALLVDQEGDTWAAGRGGVVKWSNHSDDYVKYTAVDGLAGNYVTSIAQTTDGMLWFGTHGMGLSSFDGKTWKIFTTKEGLPSNTISGLASAPDGMLWINTGYEEATKQGGLARYDGKVITAVDAPAIFDVIAVAPDGDLWAGAYRSGLYRYDSTQWQYVPLKQNNGIDITAIAFAPDGEMWVATWSDVLVFDGHSWRNLTPWNEPDAGWVKTIAVTSGGSVWLGLTLGMQGPYNEEPEDAIRPIQPKEGEPFVGLYRYEKGNWTSFTTKDGLVDNEVASIVIGKDGSIWCASYRYGISRYDKNSWEVFQTRDDLLSNDIMDMDVSGGGENVQIILGHPQGISYFDSPQWHSYSWLGEQYQGAVFIVNVDPDKSLRVGTQRGYMYFDGNDWMINSADAYNQLEGIYYISDLFNERFFVGISDGVIERAQGQWQKIPELNGQVVRAIRSTSAGTLFFATGTGIFSKSNDQWRHYTSIDGLISNEVNGLDVSPDGSVWASSCEGLSYLQGKAWITKITSTKELGCFGDMVIDQQGTIWINTPQGLFYFDDQKSNLVAFPGIIGSAQLNTRVIKIDAEGTVWIATDSGLFRYKH